MIKFCVDKTSVESVKLGKSLGTRLSPGYLGNLLPNSCRKVCGGGGGWVVVMVLVCPVIFMSNPT